MSKCSFTENLAMMQKWKENPFFSRIAEFRPFNAIFRMGRDVDHVMQIATKGI